MICLIGIHLSIATTQRESSISTSRGKKQHRSLPKTNGRTWKCVRFGSAVTLRRRSLMTVIWEIVPSLKGSASPVIRGSSLLTADAGCSADPRGLIGPATGMPSKPKTVTSLQISIK